MSQEFLYEQLDSVSKMGFLKKEMPDFLVENLNPNFELREYQKEAFARFFHCYNNDFENKERPLHLLFNMATGSGKTLIMAGLILYLYEKGYRNFLFFTRLGNIIEKTKDNFLNNQSSKFLFNDKINIGGKQVQIKSVKNFNGVNDQDINICFFTIGALHNRLKELRENMLTPEDFKDKKVVLIADEAQNFQVNTKQQKLFEEENWENTIIKKIFEQNIDNLLLEFTATIDYSNKDIVQKYLDKIIYKYDLKELELKRLNLLVEQFLSFAELQSVEQRVMYMKNWVEKLDGFLILNDKEILENAGNISHLEMEKKVRDELKRYNKQKSLVEKN